METPANPKHSAEQNHVTKLQRIKDFMTSARRVLDEYNPPEKRLKEEVEILNEKLKEAKSKQAIIGKKLQDLTTKLEVLGIENKNCLQTIQELEVEKRRKLELIRKLKEPRGKTMPGDSPKSDKSTTPTFQEYRYESLKRSNASSSKMPAKKLCETKEDIHLIPGVANNQQEKMSKQQIDDLDAELQRGKRTISDLTKRLETAEEKANLDRQLMKRKVDRLAFEKRFLQKQIDTMILEWPGIQKLDRVVNDQRNESNENDGQPQQNNINEEPLCYTLSD